MAELSLIIDQGTTRVIDVSDIVDDDGEDLDITGWTVRAVARREALNPEVRAEWRTTPTGTGAGYSTRPGRGRRSSPPSQDSGVRRGGCHWLSGVASSSRLSRRGGPRTKQGPSRSSALAGCPCPRDEASSRPHRELSSHQHLRRRRRTASARSPRRRCSCVGVASWCSPRQPRHRHLRRHRGWSASLALGRRRALAASFTTYRPRL